MQPCLIPTLEILDHRPSRAVFHIRRRVLLRKKACAVLVGDAKVNFNEQ